MSLSTSGEVASEFGAVDAPADSAPIRVQGLVRALAEQSCCIQVRHLASALSLHASCVVSNINLLEYSCGGAHCRKHMILSVPP
jgi:hypothetical protein